MTWWKTLLISLTILFLCRGEESSCRIWSEHEDVVLDNEYVFCQCNGSASTISDIQFGIKKPSISFPIEIVDNFTVEIKVIYFPWPDPDSFFCGVNKGNKSSVAAEKIYRIIPQLKMTHFECRSYHKDDVGNCTFINYKYPYRLKSKYFVSANGSPKITCVELSDYKVDCKNVHINQNITTNLFKIEMEIMGIIQSQEITINLHEIVIPNWKFMKVKYEFETEENLNCRCVRVLSQYKGLYCLVEIQKHENQHRTIFWNHLQQTIFFPNSNFCFTKILRGYTKLNPKISCRFRVDESPWSEEYIYNCTTVATRPSEPPHILPNGFFYDPDEKQLYIFWFHLDDEYWNGPNIGYAARSSDAKRATLVGKNVALFRNWEASLPATIHVWSVNSAGHSEESSSLKLDSLTNVNQQCRNLYYNDEEQVLRWDPPTDTNNLVGYTVYWCTASLNIHQICDTKDDLRMEDLSLSQHQYPFPKCMNFSNMAVAVRYSDKIGGGMRWTGYKWIRNKKPPAEPPGAGISYYLAPIGVSILIALCIYVYRICRKCNDIEVVLCEGLLLDRNISPPTPQAPTVFPGCVSPEKVMDINRLVPPKTAEMENQSQEEDSASEYAGRLDMQEVLADRVSYSFVKVSDF